MAKQNIVHRGEFPHAKIRTCLNRGKVICVVGYDLSSEARAPHYYDIQKGVWSCLTASSRINPFEYSKDYQLVMNWFNWRRGGINTRQPSKPFVALKELQQLFGIGTVTQSVDGLVHANGIEDVYELYGNVHQVKCQQGHDFPDWSSALAGNEVAQCSVCGSNLYPDVQMFSWNSKTAICDAVIDKIKHAKLLLKIGTDDDLAPFNRLQRRELAHLPIIEIMESGFLLHEGDKSFKVSMADIEAEIQQLTGENHLAAGPRNYGSAIRNFMALYQHRKQDSDHE